MKHTKKIILAMVAVMLLSMSLLVGCGGNKEPGPATLNGTTWEVTKVVSNGKEVDIGAYKSNGGMTITFSETEAVVNLQGEAKTVSYTYSDGVLDLGGESGEVRGQTMVIEESSAGVTLKQVTQ